MRQLVICIALAAAAFLISRTEMPSWSHLASTLSVIGFAVPSLIVLRKWLGPKDAVNVFSILALFALVVETLAITTGFPYGHFDYSGHLSFKLFGVVPWTVAFAWPPLMLGAFAIAASFVDRSLLRVLLSALALVMFDLVLDPGAVFFGFWSYAEPGWFYGVPASNFAGWMVSGLAGGVLMELIVRVFKPLLPVPVQLSTATFFIIFFWTCVAAFAGLVLAALTGIAALLLIQFVLLTRRYEFDDMLVLVDEQNTPIGTAPKLPTHHSATPLHRAFSVFIFDRHGRLLLQQRALSKKTWPGVWSNSCCGHPMLHESNEHAAARRLDYELGLRDVDLGPALPDYKYRAEKDGIVENEICPVYVGMIRGEPRPNPLEVAALEWTPWEEFLSSVNDPATDISPWAVEEARLLAADERFREWYVRTCN